ncbi:NAD(P)-dependent oxidoreductase [Limnohabitans sp.]|uniref:NAD(P)-dependent oxidoreductase n=1 Tax=Limnohabitans sp. TaxID=1907725 RepID=UPI00286F3376|nr:NAD(P)-dependent oxidoreductase [Limnohabitans sp.]
MTKPTIGFIGLGQMGLPMIRNLLRAQFHVMGFDLNPHAATSLTQEENFKAATSPTQVSTECDVVILMLPNSKIVDALLWDGENALAHHLNASQILVDMGSSDPVHTRENFTKLAALNIPFCDAPVSGGVKRATDGSLSIMMGGEKVHIEKIRPVLEALGKTLVHVGSSGAGHAVKALNNYVSAAGLLAVSEALVAAEKFGIDPHLVNQVFNASTGKNNTTDVKVENFMLSGSFNSGFSLALMRKDLQTALNFIDRMGTSDDFVAVCTRTWTQAESELDKGADHTAMYKFIQERT